MEVEASAPGKVFLLGEYAVALGAPAIVATVDRRLGCRVRRTSGTGQMSIRSRAGTYQGPLDAQTLEGVPAHCRFVAAAARVSALHFGMQDVDLEIATWSDLDESGPKVGLGGSAAVVAAVMAATHELCGEGGAPPLARAALGVAAHRLAQGGGSGADVVAATLGGVQWIAGLDATRVPQTIGACSPGPAVRAKALPLPQGLALDVVATGESASTGPRIRRFVDRARGVGGRGAHGTTILETWSAGMAAAVGAFRAASDAGDPEAALRAVAFARALLSRLGAVSGIRIWTGALHRACEALAPEPGVEIKPSGAGGGDCAIALARQALRGPLRQAWRAAGLQPLEVEVSPDGARVQAVREGRDHG